MSFTATPRTWVSGETVTALELNTEIRDALTGIAAAWTAFTPTLTAATTNPTGQTYTGSAYRQVGKSVDVRVNITLAATTGSGVYSLALPVAPLAGVEQVIQGLVADTGAGFYTITLRTGGSTVSQLLCDPTTAGNLLRAVSPTVPFTLGVGDTISISGTYEAA